MESSTKTESVALANARNLRGSGASIALSDALAERTKGWVKNAARLEAARAQLRLGHPDPAVKTGKDIADGTDKPILRAQALSVCAEGVMMTGGFAGETSRFDEVEGWLDEALETFEQECLEHQIGHVCWLQGILAICQGDTERSNELIAMGEQLMSAYPGDRTEETSQSRLPRFVTQRAQERVG